MKPTALYLDTARLGRMSPSAQRAHFDFTRMAGEEGGSLFFERFLQHGTSDWSGSECSYYPGLVGWRGVSALKQDLRTLAGSDLELPLLLVNRSAQLMKLAARLLFQRCRNVLVTDLGWPPYHDILCQEARRVGRQITTIPLQAILVSQPVTEEQVTSLVREQFLATRCDGLFLTAVNHLGIRLPVSRMSREIEQKREVRAIVIDGAQDFCHASVDLSGEYCDLYLAGCHKWLQGFHPMGLGFYGRRRSRGIIETLLSHLLETHELDDPLLRITNELEAAALDGSTETVNLVPLFTCQGAAADLLAKSEATRDSLPSRQRNGHEVRGLLGNSGWQAVSVSEPFQTGILVLQSQSGPLRSASPPAVRELFARRGVALTAYADGFVRLSMPAQELSITETRCLDAALHAVA